MKEWMTAAEIAALRLPGLPTTRRGVNDAATREDWECRSRAGRGGGFEYHIASLPSAAQKAIARSLAKTARAALPAPADLPDVADLKNYQRTRMDARAALLNHLDSMMRVGGISQGKAVDALVAAAARGELPPELQKLVPIANARSNAKRTFSRPTVYNWLNDRSKAGGKAIGLAPAAAPAAAIPSWAPTFMRLNGRPSKPNMSEVLDYLWPEGEEKPSYDQVRRFMKKVDAIGRNAGRMGPRALKTMQAYIVRDTSNLWPGAVFIGDGHTWKAEVAHPSHGRPFRPEITSILDVYTRRWVGWSAALAENTWSVADALRHAVTTTTCCDIFYYDNGSGAKNSTWDDDLVGLAARLSITKFHSAPWSSQARGVIERFNSTVLHTAARALPTYVGQRMDPEARQKAYKITRKDIKQFGQSSILIRWPDFKAFLDHCQNDYNGRPHSALPKRFDPATGKRRHMSPDEMWAMSVAEGWRPSPIPDDEANDLFRPVELRKVQRGVVLLFGNEYSADALEHLHGEKVQVAYDIHDASRVRIRLLDGRLVCDAGWNANHRDYMPVSFVERAREKRVEGKLARLDAHRETALAERSPAALVEYRRAPEAAPISPEEQARLDSLAAELSGHAAQPPQKAEVLDLAEVQRAKESKKDRFLYALELRRGLGDGLPVPDSEAAWLARYERSPEFIALFTMYEDFGLDGLSSV
jgi:putative transposase